MMFWITLVVLSAIIICAETFIIVKQMGREDKLTEIANTAVANLEEVDQLIRNSEQLLDNPKLKEAFAHDDEVGDYFKNLEQMQEILNNYLRGDGQVE